MHGGSENHSVSVITTKANITRSVGLLKEAFSEPAVARLDAANGSYAVPYAVEDVPGKGKGCGGAYDPPRRGLHGGLGQHIGSRRPDEARDG